MTGKPPEVYAIISRPRNAARQFAIGCGGLALCDALPPGTLLPVVRVRAGPLGYSRRQSPSRDSFAKGDGRRRWSLI